LLENVKHKKGLPFFTLASLYFFAAFCSFLQRDVACNVACKGGL